MIDQMNTRMQKTLASFKDDLTSIRTGRAHVSLLDHVSVPYYGSDVPVSQVANISVPESRTLAITPWEKTMLASIEKAIMVSDLGITPSNDGDVIRLVLPELTQERRLEFVRQVKQLTEKSKIAIRNIRRDVNDAIKAQVKDKELSEDEARRLQDEVQKITDKNIAEAEKIAERKEEDILTI